MAPNTNTPTDVPTFELLIDGAETDSANYVKSIVIGKETNKIAYAQIIVADGSEIKDGFTISDTDDFIPGKEIEIKAGYHSKNTTVFKGIIMKHGIKKTIRRSELIVECKHPAVIMTLGEKNKYFFDVKDSDIIEELAQPYGISLQAEATKVTHKAMVQYRVSDWEFMLMRATVNGQLIFTRDDEIEIVAPDLAGAPALTLDPDSIMEIESEMDATQQLKAVSASAWNPTDQQAVATEAEVPNQNEQGNITAETLADINKLEAYELRHTGPVEDPELQAWANATLLKSRLEKMRGRIKYQGDATLKPGDVAEIKDIGARFNGTIYITGVRHQIDSKNWETDIQFGLAPNWYNTPTKQQQGHTTLSQVSGLHIGVVTQLQDDPLGEDRILVKAPLISEEEDGVWARMASLDAGENRGTCFRPEIDDEVVIGFLDNDPRYPLVLGMLHSSAKPAPIPASDDNHEKGIITREELKLLFNDETKVVTIETPNGNMLAMSDEDGGITLEDENGNTILINSDGISLEDANGNSILMSGDGLTLESAKDLILKASGDVKIEGVNIEAAASAEFKGEGSASATISASGNTIIEGAMVMIN